MDRVQNSVLISNDREPEHVRAELNALEIFSGGTAEKNRIKMRARIEFLLVRSLHFYAVLFCGTFL